MIVYDDLEQSEKIKVNDKGITLNKHQNPEELYQMLVGYRTGTCLPRRSTESRHFAARSITSCMAFANRKIQ